ncbi:Arginase/deacetylase [Jaminaea rosea]|uniref:Arginase/deacetylase n=1 Tax=Jaminaea rosea TaxID=1569628 RepID=A0A316UTK5_9BASI|nr:Arginase/deacetylase [Jaminaea rosea]PWN28626.1 Arginase/deacetylase [Jaminaea rosea]
MPLIVKIPNPHHRRKDGEDTAAEASHKQPDSRSTEDEEQDTGYRTAASTMSPSPPISNAARDSSAEPHAGSSGPIYPTLPERTALDVLAELSLQRKPEVKSHDSPVDAMSKGSDPLPASASPAPPTPLDASHPVSTPALSPPIMSAPPLLDILVAPAVLAHRYVRGRDVSLIVERPERIRACLLGVASLLGRIAAGELQEQQAGKGSGVTGDDADDLVARLAGMSVDRPAGEVLSPEQQQASSSSSSTPLQVLHSTRSVSLASHPAVRAVHALESGCSPEEDEQLIDCLPTAYEARKAARKKQRQAGLPISSMDISTETNAESSSSSAAPRRPFLDYLTHLCNSAPHEPPPAPPPPPPRAPRGAAGSATSTPSALVGGRTRSSVLRQGGTSTASSAAGTPVVSPAKSRTGASAFADVAVKKEEESLAPTTAITNLEGTSAAAVMTPTTSRSDFLTTESQSRPAAAINASSDSDSDDDDDMLHASEVPEHLSQGDLYLRGSRRSREGADAAEDPSLYGSREAMEHAVGATIEAVDRVMKVGAAADHGKSNLATNGSLGGALTPLVFHAPSQDSASSVALPHTAPSRSALVLTRPPGHHCSSSLPSGFCWINNVAIAAQHAYQQYGVDRVVILDIDLHHGNGTQKIVWRINEEAERLDREREARIASMNKRASPAKKKSAAAVQPPPQPLPPRALRVCYASLHDIESFPCEDGNPDLVRDASTTILGAHGQWISNTHLETYSSAADFQHLYTTQYRPALIGHARRFLERTAADPDRTLVLLSCGFDACEHEMQGMQRHGKRVPVGFYRQVVDDVTRELASPFARGRVVTLLEGGYGDRALLSGILGLGLGFLEARQEEAQQGEKELSTAQGPVAMGMDPYHHAWFSLESLKATEKLLAPHHSNAPSRRGAATPAWLQQTEGAFAQFEALCKPLMSTAATRRR